jgi:hypothetical protein
MSYWYDKQSDMSMARRRRRHICRGCRFSNSVSFSQLRCHVDVIFPKNLKLMSSVGADERDAPAISVRNAVAVVALYFDRFA